jgi:hypothetical protein
LGDLAVDPGVVARGLGCVSLDLGLELRRRPAASWPFEQLDRTDPALHPVLAEQVIQEQEGSLDADVWSTSVKRGCQRRTSRRRRFASHDVLARISSRSNRAPATISVINVFAGCFEAWYSHVASGCGARSSQRSATWRRSGSPLG